jgi:PEGA domain
MTKKYRYSLLAFGFIFFLIAAPLIVLYVKGVGYNFGSKTFVQTGILAVRSDPSDPAIFLDGKQKRQGQGDLTFLLPGSYELTLKKDGYNDWTKRMTVQAGQVTWASPSFGNIYLFLKNPTEQTLASGVLDFYERDKNFIYIDSGSLVTSAINSPGQTQTFPLPRPVNKIVAQDEAGKNFILSNLPDASSSPTVLVFNQNLGKIYDISSMFQTMPQLLFGDDGQLYALSNNILYSINPAAKTKTALFNGVSVFEPEGGALYFIMAKSGINGLFVSQAPFTTSQELANSLPVLNSSQLFVTFEKEILLVTNGDLYLASSGMTDLADNISAYGFNPTDSFLSVIHSGELDYYDPIAGSLNFITRSSQTISNPVISSSIGNAFFAQDNRLMVIELDDRDSQNQYQLYQGTDLQKFYADNAGKNVLVLDNGTLKSLVIR